MKPYKRRVAVFYFVSFTHSSTLSHLASSRFASKTLSLRSYFVIFLVLLSIDNGEQNKKNLQLRVCDDDELHGSLRLLLSEGI